MSGFEAGDGYEGGAFRGAGVGEMAGDRARVCV